MNTETEIPPLPEGLRILLVEDDPDTVRLVTYILREALSRPVIEVSGTVADAQDKLITAVDKAQPYDIAILDFMLPAEAPNQPAEPDHSLGYLARDLSVQTLIIHVTAYQNDPRFRSFLRFKESSPDVGRLCVAKEKGWTKQLIREIRHTLVPYRLRLRFDSLFRRERSLSFRRAGAKRWVTQRSDRKRALEIAALCADASKHWEFLSPTLKKELERVLGHTQDAKGNHFVGIVKSETAGSDQEDDLRL